MIKSDEAEDSKVLATKMNPRGDYWIGRMEAGQVSPAAMGKIARIWLWERSMVYVSMLVFLVGGSVLLTIYGHTLPLPKNIVNVGGFAAMLLCAYGFTELLRALTRPSRERQVMSILEADYYAGKGLDEQDRNAAGSAKTDKGLE